MIWRLDYSTKPTAPEGTQACEESGSCIGRILIGAETSTACASVNTPVTSITKTEGCHELFAKVVAGEKTMVHGTYIIDVSGCTLVSLNSVSGPTSTCAPLASVKVEFGGIDLFDVPSAQDLKDAEDWRSTRARIVNQYACQLPLATEKDGHFGEDITSILLAKLFFASDPHTDFSGSLYLDCDRLNDRFLMAPQVNGFLRGVNRVREVGTDLRFDNKVTILAISAGVGALTGAAIGAAVGGVIGAAPGAAVGAAAGAVIGAFVGLFGVDAALKCIERPGDWDMTMVGLLRVAYDYEKWLEPTIFNHVLYDLLSAAA